MEGLQYIINDKRKKKAAVIDLDLDGDLWEDSQDILVVEARKSWDYNPLDKRFRRIGKDGISCARKS